MWLQDSAAVQILLEICLPTSEEQLLGATTESLLRNNWGPVPGKLTQGNLPTTTTGRVEDTEPEGGLLSDLREVQCLICCLLHQMFIADPNIAKLVHFQVNPAAASSCCPPGFRTKAVAVSAGAQSTFGLLMKAQIMLTLLVTTLCHGTGHKQLQLSHSYLPAICWARAI